jgi:hypothetical protein
LNNLQIETTWTDKDWDKFTDWLKGMLHVGPVTVTFTKKDGSERVMKCTLDPKELPEQVITENKKERKQSDNSIAVYDLEAKGWRSFVIRSIKRVNITIP